MSKLNLIKAKGVYLSLGDKEVELVYDFNAFAELEKEFGNVQTAFEAMSANPRMTDILKIVKAGLASSDEEISVKELGKYLTPREIPELVKLMSEALVASLPEQEKEVKTKNAKN